MGNVAMNELGGWSGDTRVPGDNDELSQNEIMRLRDAFNVASVPTKQAQMFTYRDGVNYMREEDDVVGSHSRMHSPRFAAAKDSRSLVMDYSNTNKYPHGSMHEKDLTQRRGTGLKTKTLEAASSRPSTRMLMQHQRHQKYGTTSIPRTILRRFIEEY